MRIRDIILRSTRALQPLATAVDVGTLYYVTDEFIIERSNGTIWQSYSASASASGDVVGPASAVDDRIATYDGTTGKLIQDGGKTIAAVESSAVATAASAVAGSITTLESATYLTENDESADLPNSRQLVAGANITFDDTVANVRSIAASGGGGGAAGWTHIATHVLSGAVANVDFINLSTYNQLLVIIRLLTSGGNTLRYLRVSSDNGATFLAASGDYKIVDNGGTESNDTELRFMGSVNSAGVSGWITIDNFNTAFPKTTVCPNLGPANNGIRFIPTTSPLDAIRVFPSSGTINAGTIYVFGKV